MLARRHHLRTRHVSHSPNRPWISPVRGTMVYRIRTASWTVKAHHRTGKRRSLRSPERTATLFMVSLDTRMKFVRTCSTVTDWCYWTHKWVWCTIATAEVMHGMFMMPWWGAVWVWYQMAADSRTSHETKRESHVVILRWEQWWVPCARDHASIAGCGRTQHCTHAYVLYSGWINCNNDWVNILWKSLDEIFNYDLPYD